MAKRKRLTPAQTDYLDAPPAGLETKGMFPLGVARTYTRAPIAQVAGDASSAAALSELAAEMRAARDEGRMVQSLPLDAVDASYLVRDRMTSDEDELQALMASLKARGQQTPVEVVALEDGRYGLISGWRRVTALGRLHDETGDDRFATVQALLRRPESASDAYLAMVEENEIRVNLSYYERARIVARAAEMGVFRDEATALRELFASASRPKRSKIGSFLALYHALDARLSFPAAISERLGLTLARQIAEDERFGAKLADRLRKAAPQTPEAEIAVLGKIVGKAGAVPATPGPGSIPAAAAAPRTPSPAIELHADSAGGIRLAGPGVTPEFRKRLEAWIAAQLSG